MNSALRSLVSAAAAVCLGAAAVHAQEASGRRTEPSAIEFSPVSPFIRIYAAQSARRLTDKDELIIGGGYTNIKSHDGQSHAPTFIIGCRRVRSGRRRARSTSCGRPTIGTWEARRRKAGPTRCRAVERIPIRLCLRLQHRAGALVRERPVLCGWGLYGDESKLAELGRTRSRARARSLRRRCSSRAGVSSLWPRGFAPRTPRHASRLRAKRSGRASRSLGEGGLSRAASPARSVRVARSRRSSVTDDTARVGGARYPRKDIGSRRSKDSLSRALRSFASRNPAGAARP